MIYFCFNQFMFYKRFLRWKPIFYMIFHFSLNLFMFSIKDSQEENLNIVKLNANMYLY